MTETNRDAVLWARGILNGVLAWILALLVSMIPAIVVAVKMGFELGPQVQDSAEVSSQISETISAMYQNNDYITIGFLIVTILLIYWRAGAVLKKATGEYVINALLVAAFPVLLSILSFFSSGIELSAVAEIILFPLAAYAAAYFKR